MEGSGTEFTAVSSGDPGQIWAETVAKWAGNPAADQVVLAARVVFADRDATIAGLQAELDAYQGRTVYFCLDAQLAAATVQSIDAGAGTIIRATDTGREMELTEGGWRERGR